MIKKIDDIDKKECLDSLEEHIHKKIKIQPTFKERIKVEQPQENKYGKVLITGNGKSISEWIKSSPVFKESEDFEK